MFHTPSLLPAVMVLVPRTQGAEQIVGIIGESIRIPCAGATPDALVLWQDLVYNRQDAPQTIFVSTDNPDFRVSHVSGYGRATSWYHKPRLSEGSILHEEQQVMTILS